MEPRDTMQECDHEEREDRYYDLIDVWDGIAPRRMPERHYGYQAALKAAQERRKQQDEVDTLFIAWVDEDGRAAVAPFSGIELEPEEE